MKVLPSKYLFLKNFSTLITIEKKYFCPHCLNILRYVNHETSRCETCAKNFSDAILRQNYNYFVTLSLESQIEDILESELYYSMRKASNSESDVINDKVYRNLLDRGIVGPNDLTLQFNTDGAKTCQSAKKINLAYICIDKRFAIQRKVKKCTFSLGYGTDQKSQILIFI